MDGRGLCFGDYKAVAALVAGGESPRRPLVSQRAYESPASRGAGERHIFKKAVSAFEIGFSGKEAAAAEAAEPRGGIEKKRKKAPTRNLPGLLNWETKGPGWPASLGARACAFTFCSRASARGGEEGRLCVARARSTRGGAARAETTTAAVSGSAPAPSPSPAFPMFVGYERRKRLALLGGIRQRCGEEIENGGLFWWGKKWEAAWLALTALLPLSAWGVGLLKIMLATEVASFRPEGVGVRRSLRRGGRAAGFGLFLPPSFIC